MAVRRAPLFPGKFTWLAVILVGVVDAGWLVLSERLSLDPLSLFSLAPSAAALAVLALYCRDSRSERLRKLYLPLIGTLFIIVAFTSLRVFNHLTMSVAFPLADNGLARIDAALGLNWLSYASWVSRSPLVVKTFGLAYTGLTLISLVIFALLLAGAGRVRAEEFVRLIFWTGLVATAIGAFFPAKAAMANFASSDLMAAFGPDAGVYHLPYLEALRSARAHVLDLRELPGLVVIPSFHTACGLLIAYSCRGLRWISWATAGYAAIMIASTPIMGGHYFIDLIAGMFLTLAIIWIDKRVRRITENAAALRSPAGIAVPDRV